MDQKTVRKTPSMRVVELENGEPIEQFLRRRLQAGATVREIARDIGIHYAMLYDWLVLFDIPSPSKARRDYGMAEVS